MELSDKFGSRQRGRQSGSEMCVWPTRSPVRRSVEQIKGIRSISLQANQPEGITRFVRTHMCSHRAAPSHSTEKAQLG